MAQVETNLDPRLTREIRFELGTVRLSVAGWGRMTGMERHMGDARAGVPHALGVSARANVGSETTGQRRDRPSDRTRQFAVQLDKLEGSE
jgi:hypothetical protein